MSDRLRIPAGFDQLPALGLWIRQFAADAALPSTMAYRLDLILAELVTNVMEHGFRGEPSPGWIDIRCQPGAASVRVVIRDNAGPFDPTASPEPVRPDSLDQATPNGRGLRLVRRYASGMRYRREAGENVLELDVAMTANG